MGAHNDPLEQEADRAATETTSAGDIHGAPPTVSRSSSRTGGHAAGDASLGTRIKSPGGGRALPEAIRNDLGSRFDADFSAVRVHDTDQDRMDAENLGARAFTHKHNIWLGRNSDVNDRALMAHELTHVIQQGTDVRRKPGDQPPITGAGGNSDAPDTGPRVGNSERIKPTLTATTGEAPDVQGAWYNFHIPFTDYEFDPSISGAKTAAGVVKDAVVDSATWAKDRVADAFEWIWEKIKGILDTGAEWLKAKFREIEAFATSSFDTIAGGLRSLLSAITSPAAILNTAFKMLNADLIGGAWKMLKSGAQLLWSGIRGTINTVLGIGTGLWDSASGYVDWLFDTVDGLMDSWPFRQLPGIIQDNARRLFDQVRASWEKIRAFLTDLLKRLRDYIDRVLGGIERFVTNIVDFAIDAVVDTVKKLAEAWELIKIIAADPIAYLRPHVDKIAAKVNVDAPPKAEQLAKENLEENFRREPGPGGADIVVQRLPDDTKQARTRAGFTEAFGGIWTAIKESWSQLDIGQMLLDTIVNMFYPPATIKAVANEFSELVNNDWANAAGRLFTPRWEFPEFFLDLWSNLLILLDFPIALWRRVNNIVMLLMGWITILLIVAGALLGGVVGGALAGPPGILGGAAAGAGLALEFAATLGIVMLKSFFLAEAAAVVRTLAELFSNRQTDAEKERDYVSIAGSVLAMAVAAILYVLMMILGAFLNRLIAAVKGKAPAASPAEAPRPAEPPKAPEPPKPAEPPKAAEPPKPAEPPKAPETTPGEPAKAEPPKSGESKPAGPTTSDVEPVPGKPNVFKVKPSALKSTKPRWSLIANKAWWHWELYVELPNGEIAVWCEINIRFRGSADLNLDPTKATIRGTSRTVELKLDGGGWTNKALDMMQETYTEKFGHPPRTLGGWLAKVNLKAFQESFVKFRLAHPELSVEELAQLAIRETPFGKARIKGGFGNFKITIVTVEDHLILGKMHTVPDLLRVEASKAPLGLPRVPPIVPQPGAEGESGGDETDQAEE